MEKHIMEKDFLEEQLDLLHDQMAHLEARISKIDRKLGDIDNNLKVLHDTLNKFLSGLKVRKENNNVIDINTLKSSNGKEQFFKGMTLEELEVKYEEAIKANIEQGKPPYCGKVPTLKYGINLLKNPTYKSNSVKRLDNLNFENSLFKTGSPTRSKSVVVSPKRRELQGLYNQIQSLEINAVLEFPSKQVAKVRYAVHSGNSRYGTDFKIKTTKNWANPNVYFVKRVK